jgi:hypothetical protein
MLEAILEKAIVWTLFGATFASLLVVVHAILGIAPLWPA